MKEIIGYTYDTLVKWLETQDTYYGMLKSRINCEDLEAAIRTSFPEITWVSARVSGTRLLIHIKENEVLSVIPDKDDAPRDIVASKSGIITSMVVRQGIAQVAPGDEVEAGQVLDKRAYSHYRGQRGGAECLLCPRRC